MLPYAVIMIADNLASVRQRIATCCARIGRSPNEVTLVCVTKNMPVGSIEEAIRAGVTDIGENRVQEACDKHRQIGARLHWHLVGHLQTNKAAGAVSLGALIHSVDSVRIATALEKAAAIQHVVQRVLIEVNISGETTKFGVHPDQTEALAAHVDGCAHLSLAGLMTIAPIGNTPEEARIHFRRLRELLAVLNAKRLPERQVTVLSMGMTDDFEVAIEEGATMVRIGRAIMGERPA